MSRARDIANYGDGIDASSINSGTFADARIAQSNVTQHESAIDALASNPTIQLGSNATFPSDHIIQVVTSATISGSTTSSSDQTIASPTITTTKTNSKILILGTLFANSASSSGNNFIFIKLVYSSTTLISGYPIVGSYGASDVRATAAFNFLHSPNVSSGTTLTYDVKINAQYASTVYVNNSTSPSKIIFMELAP